MDCVICTETIQNPASLNCCRHSFCTACILSWSKQSSTCPCCRKEIEYIIDSDLKFHIIQHVKARTPSQDYIQSYDESSSNSLDDFVIPDDSSLSVSESLDDDFESLDSESLDSSQSSSRDGSPLRIRAKRSISKVRARLPPRLTLVRSSSTRGRALDRAVSERLLRLQSNSYL